MTAYYFRISDWSSDVCSSVLNRRPRLTGSQTWLVLATVPLAIVIAWGLTRDAELGGAAVGYTAIVAAMAASAWASRFPRYRTGIGAMLFLASDLFIFAGEGGVDRKSGVLGKRWVVRGD